MSESIRVIRRVQVQSLTGLGRSSLYQAIANGRFPRSIPLGPRSVGWIESEITDWIRSRVAARTELANTANRSNATRASQQVAA